jgi:hypothetical protein
MNEAQEFKRPMKEKGVSTEGGGSGRPVCKYKKDSKGAEDYDRLVHAVMEI